MRLTVAAGLLAHTLPAACKTEYIDRGLVLENRKEGFTKIVQDELPSFHILAGKWISMQKKSRALVTSKWSGALKNMLPIRPECDPSSNEADLGVLSCGVGKYCMTSTTSSLGGICVVRSMQMDRWLQQSEASPSNSTYRHRYADVCGTFSTDFEEYCDCTGFDVETETGTISCFFGYNYCIAGCNEACFNLTYTYTKYAGSSPAYGYCYDFTSPYSESFCKRISETSYYCKYILDGTPCNSCKVAPISNYYDDPAYANGTCTIWDCENVGLGSGLCMKGNVYTPSMNACAGNGTDSPTETYAPMNTSAPTTFVCEVCGAGMVVTKPNGIVSAPNQYDKTCSEVDTAAQAGEISDLACQFIQRLTDACGCEVPNGSPAASTRSFQDPSQSTDTSTTEVSDQTQMKTASSTIAKYDSTGLALFFIGLSMTMFGFLAS